MATFGSFGSQPATSAFNFGAPATTAPTLSFGAQPSTGFGFGAASTASKPSGSSFFGTPATTASTTFGFPSAATSSASNLAAQPGSAFGATATANIYQFPKKTQDQSTSTAGPSQSQSTTTNVKVGFSGMKPRDHIIDDPLKSEVLELEKRIRKFRDTQKGADAYTLQDATEWEVEIKDYDRTASKIQKKLQETFSVIDVLRKNAARLYSNTLLSTRLSSSPSAYYSIASAIESYFMEVMSGLRTEMEILEDELNHLENLHEDLLRSGNERYNPRDLQATYAYLSKIVGGIAVAVDEMLKIGQDLRKEIQIMKGGGGPVAVPQQAFMAQDVAQLSAARSLFSAPTIAASATPKHLSALSKSPLLQQVNADQQFTIFNPAMRALNRMDSMSTPAKSTIQSSSTSSAGNRLGGFGLFPGATSPGF
ncbi:uncharacterized protein LOC129581010 [Paramacrobiotus metropolitanus]|uniref:uncharacterized protein LOC129581010 n=1 Tax=Paramacrobiotus metropolitanus TaxID=2943436 RepID=UPI002445C5BF|nr:uncharacterized protein LOC129581010 [Paramacrobiotus metropolitanus]